MVISRNGHKADDLYYLYCILQILWLLSESIGRNGPFLQKKTEAKML